MMPCPRRSIAVVQKGSRFAPYINYPQYDSPFNRGPSKSSKKESEKGENKTKTPEFSTEIVFC